MKAEELMIGDWVINPVHNDKVRVKGIYFDMELHHLVITDGRFPQEYFEPIPLTAEILKKNKYTEYPLVYGIQTAKPTLVVEKINGGFGISIQGKTLMLNYVHELQHALRLCGLNDLADNFKV